MDKPLVIRPYARLLTMLGEQLIKNERIALVELIKNAYDADASWVKVSFLGFGENYEVKQDSKIVIEDNGIGMSQEVIEKHWVSPATPIKKKIKAQSEKTKKGRVIQGEKGIGRFALLKLGRAVQIVTRPAKSNVEYILDLDLTAYDEDFLSKNGKEVDLYLEDIPVRLRGRDPKRITNEEIKLGSTRSKRSGHGTAIQISSISGSWTRDKVDAVFRDLARLESIFTEDFLEDKPGRDREREFEIFIYKDDIEQQYTDKYLDDLRRIVETQSVLKVEKGRYDEDERTFSFILNGVPQRLSLSEPEMTGLKVFKDHFGEAGKELRFRGTQCGSFSFGFYVFDFSAGAPGNFRLEKIDKELIRQHRIYLYRDGIRVYPYGDPEDDWLQIDMYRGTISAGMFLSNDQVVGHVNISQRENPGLRDKTNREGLVETGHPTDDFKCLLQSFLAYLRSYPYARYREGLQDKRAISVFKEEKVKQGIEALKEKVADNKEAKAAVASLEKEYQAERQYLVQRAETTEELAGVGLSVETASHDIMSVMEKAGRMVDSLIKDTLVDRELDRDSVSRDLAALKGMLGFIESQLKDIQLLFKSSKQRRRQIRVADVLEKVAGIFQSTLRKEKIEFQVESIGPPLAAKTTDAVLLQLFLNLFDNSVYWLGAIDRSDKCIRVTLDGNDGLLIFSDNGPGINKSDIPYIFEPFYSGRGEDGRGLGLYIARQLLERHEYEIDLADLKSQRKLSGANFIISFVKESS